MKRLLIIALLTTSLLQATDAFRSSNKCMNLKDTYTSLENNLITSPRENSSTKLAYYQTYYSFLEMCGVYNGDSKHDAKLDETKKEFRLLIDTHLENS